MKDLVISARRIRREIRFAAAAFIVAFLTNLYAVVRFDRPWYELFTQMGYVVVITAVIYLLLWITRLLAALVSRMGGRRGAVIPVKSLILDKHYDL